MRRPEASCSEKNFTGDVMTAVWRTQLASRSTACQSSLEQLLLLTLHPRRGFGTTSVMECLLLLFLLSGFMGILEWSSSMRMHCEVPSISCHSHKSRSETQLFLGVIVHFQCSVCFGLQLFHLCFFFFIILL